MKILLLLLPLLDFPAQEGDISTLIERLKSAELRDRDAAAKKLLDLGEAARAALETIAKDSDVDASIRAKEILTRLDIRAKMGPLLRAVPDAEDKLAAGGDQGHMDVLLAGAAEDHNYARLHPELGVKDLESLLPRAMRALRLRPDNEKIYRVLVGRRLLSARPFLYEVARSVEPDDHSSTALSALLDLADLKDLPNLLALLEEHPEFVSRADDTLRDLRAKSAVPLLRKCLHHGRQDVRRTAVQLLAALEGSRAGPDLLPLLDDPDWNIEYWALQELSWIGEKKAIPGIALRLKSPETPTRREAPAALARLGARESIPQIRRLLDDKHSEVRGAAAEALGCLQDQDSAPRIATILSSSKDWYLNQSLVQALRDLKHTESYPILLAHLKSDNSGPPGSRCNAARAVVELRPKEAFQTLAPFLRDPAPELCSTVTELLSRIDREGTAKILLQMLERDETRHSALTSLALIGEPRADKFLGSPTEDAYRELLRGRARELGLLGVRSLIPRLRKSLEHPYDTDQAYGAALVLGGLRDRESLPLLRAFYRRLYVEARPGIARLFADLGDRDMAPELRPLLSRPFEDRMVAAAALARLGDPTGVPILFEGSCDRKVSLNPLNAIRSPETWNRLEKATTDRAGFESVSELVDEIGRALQLTVHLPADYVSVPVPLAGPAGRPLMDWMEDLNHTRGRFEFILDPAEIRVVYRADALDFWEDWWEKR